MNRMSTTRKLLAVFVVAMLGAFVGSRIQTVYAQANAPFAIAVGSATHTSCPAVVASVTQYCAAADGPYVSISGTAWQAIPLTPATAGVASVTVCNAAGASCGTPQTGVVSLNIPKTATASAPTVTAPTVTLQ